MGDIALQFSGVKIMAADRPHATNGRWLRTVPYQSGLPLWGEGLLNYAPCIEEKANCRLCDLSGIPYPSSLLLRESTPGTHKALTCK
jgi:hypothetical protein